MQSEMMKQKYPQSGILFKDTVYLEMLGLPVKYKESKLRKEIIAHMKAFILEMGKDFLFIDDEHRIKVGSKTFKVDLLFYHRALRCLVDVELKAIPFEPEFVGKMDFYLSAIDHEIKREDENPTVGIILCPSAEQCDVRYALDRTMSPVMIAEYRRLLVPEEVMKKSLEEYCAFMKQEEMTRSGKER